MSGRERREGVRRPRIFDAGDPSEVVDPPRVFDATAAVGAVAWVAVGGLVAVGALRLVGPPTAALAVVLVVAVVVPMVARIADLPFRDGTRSRPYRAAAVLMPVGAAATVVSLALPTGSLAAALAVPWFATTVLLAVYGVQRGLPNAGRPAELAVSVGLCYLPVAGVALVLHRLGATVGFTATTMLLTVVHFHYAGGALPVFAGLLGRESGGRTYRALLVPTLVGPGLVGLGIALSPGPELLAAGLLAVSAAGLALYSLLAVPVRDGAGRTLVGLSAVSVTVSMGLVVAYLASRGTGVPLVTFETMLAGHGWLNAVGFALLGLTGWRLVDPATSAPPLGLPVSRLTSRGRVGSDYLDRYGLRADGDAAGMVDRFSAFDGPRCEAAAVHPEVRRFYERTADYALHVEPSWSPGLRLGARLYAWLGRRVEQMNFGVHGRAPEPLSSRIVSVDDAADGRADVRSWVRTYDDTGAAIYVALYATHRLDGTPYMNIAFPLPWTNLTSVLSVERLGDGDPGGVELSTGTGGDAGIYLRTQLGPLRLPMDETIRVSASGADVGVDAGLEGSDADLYARHEVRLFGRRFLELDYRMTRLPSA